MSLTLTALNSVPISSSRTAILLTPCSLINFMASRTVEIEVAAMTEEYRLRTTMVICAEDWRGTFARQEFPWHVQRTKKGHHDLKPCRHNPQMVVLISQELIGRFSGKGISTSSDSRTSVSSVSEHFQEGDNCSVVW